MYKFDFLLDGKKYHAVLKKREGFNPWDLWGELLIDGLRPRAVNYDNTGYPWFWFKQEKTYLYHLVII
jgi:hypothetical protein